MLPKIAESWAFPLDQYIIMDYYSNNLIHSHMLTDDHITQHLMRSLFNNDLIDWLMSSVTRYYIDIRPKYVQSSQATIVFYDNSEAILFKLMWV